MLALLSAFVTGFHTSSGAFETPTVLPLEIRSQISSVTLGGYRFVIDTGASQTLVKATVLEDLLKKRKGEFQVSGISLEQAIGIDSPGLFAGLSHSLLRIDGILGFDALWGDTFGFDYRNRTLTVWPGSQPEEDEKEWVAQDTKPAQVTEIETHPLEAASGCWLPQEANGHPLLFDSGADECLLAGAPSSALVLPKALAVTLFGVREIAEWMCPKLDCNQLSRPLQMAERNSFGDFDVITPSYLSADRLLIDYSGSRLLVGAPDRNLLATNIWRPLGLERRRDGIYLALPQAVWPTAASFNGSRVLRIGKIDVKHLDSMVLKGDTAAASPLAEIDRSLWAGTRVTLERKGHPIEIRISKPDLTALRHRWRNPGAGLDFSITPSSPQATSAFSSAPFPLQKGVNVLPEAYSLVNVPKAWITPGPGGSTIVTVPGKAGS